MGKPDTEKNGRHFVIRVITKSHPWGYDYSDNKKPLDAQNKYAAMDFRGIEDNIFGRPPKKFYPLLPMDSTHVLGYTHQDISNATEKETADSEKNR